MLSDSRSEPRDPPVSPMLHSLQSVAVYLHWNWLCFKIISNQAPIYLSRFLPLYILLRSSARTPECSEYRPQFRPHWHSPRGRCRQRGLLPYRLKLKGATRTNQFLSCSPCQLFQVSFDPCQCVPCDYGFWIFKCLFLQYTSTASRNLALVRRVGIDIFAF